MGNTGRTHHLLKHKLPEGDVREHFGSTEPREILKEIGRMGQRELQAKFRAVYGAPTYSNNNNWLRRKLMEAAGLQPHKTAARSRAKPPSSGLSGGDVEQHRTLMGQRAVTSTTSPASSRLKASNDTSEANSQGVRRTNRVRRPKQYEDMVYQAADSVLGQPAGSGLGDGLICSPEQALQSPFGSSMGYADHVYQHSAPFANRPLQLQYRQSLEHKSFTGNPMATISASAVQAQMALLNQRLWQTIRQNGQHVPARAGPQLCSTDAGRLGWQGLPAAAFPMPGRECTGSSAANVWPAMSGDSHAVARRVQLAAGNMSPTNTDAFSTDTNYSASGGVTSALPACTPPTAAYSFESSDIWHVDQTLPSIQCSGPLQDLESTCTAEDSNNLEGVPLTVPMQLQQPAEDETSLLLGNVPASAEMDAILAPAFAPHSTPLFGDFGYQLGCKTEALQPRMYDGMCQGYDILEADPELAKLF